MEKNNKNIFKNFFEKNTIIFFLLSFAFSFWFIFELNHTYLKFPEFWAEEGIFYQDFLYKDFTKIDMYIDGKYPYFAIFPRLITIITKLINIPIEHVPYFYHFMSIIFVCLCTSIFCLKKFSCIIKSDFFRFLLSILLSLNHDYENKLLLNSAYYGSIPSILYIFYLIFSKNHISKLNSSLIGLMFFILMKTG